MDNLQRTIEIERIVNLIRGFGWDLKETRVDGDTLRIVVEKKVESAPPAA